MRYVFTLSPELCVCVEMPGENWTQQYLVLVRQQAEGQYPAVPFIRARSLLLLLLVVCMCVHVWKVA